MDPLIGPERRLEVVISGQRECHADGRIQPQNVAHNCRAREQESALVTQHCFPCDRMATLELLEEIPKMNQTRNERANLVKMRTASIAADPLSNTWHQIPSHVSSFPDVNFTETRGWQ